MIGLAALTLATAAGLGQAQIQRLDLEQMVGFTSDVVHGQIIDATVFRSGDDERGLFYYTRLTVQGHSLATGHGSTVDVLFLGGWINETEGADYSEAPSADDVQVGNKVVVFYNWAENVGAGVSGNFIYAAHGGLYRTLDGPQGPMVLGRGDGYAIAQNTRVAALESNLEFLYRRKAEQESR